MEKKLNHTIYFIVATYFIILFFGIFPDGNKMPEISLVLLQVSVMLFFLLVYIKCMELPVETLKPIVFIYQCFGVAFFYLFYIFVYNDPLGYMPADAFVYNRYALIGQDLNLKDYFELLYIEREYNYSDWGFFVLLKYVYALPGDGILYMKIINMLLNFCTILVMYKMTLILAPPYIAKYVFILFGLNPLTFFFEASGLKEVVFLFIIVAAFYFVYKYISEKRTSYLIYGIAISILFIFFRPLLFIAFVCGWTLYFFFNSGGKDKLLYIFLLIILFAGAAYLIYNLLQDEISVYLNFNVEGSREERLSSATGEIGSSEFSIINRFAGFFGPIPTLLQLGGKDTEILQSMGVIIKIFLSVFNIYFIYLVIAKKAKEFYPICFFIFFTVLMMVFSSSSLDMRFHYTYFPFFILSSLIGMDKLVQNRKSWISTVYFYVIFFVIFIWNQRV